MHHAEYSEEVLSIDEAARLLGFGRGYTRELVRIGVLPHVHVGRRIVLYKEDVLAYREDAKQRHMLSHKRSPVSLQAYRIASRVRRCEREQA